MKKLITWVVFILSIFLLGCSKTENIPAEETTIEWKTVIKSTLKDLVKKEQQTTCSFTFEDETTKENWTIYIKEWKAKSITNIELKKENMNIEAYTIIKDDYTYTRSSVQQSQWAKFKNLDTKESEKYKEDPIGTKELQLVCETKEIDDDLFIIPSEISFIDITDYLINK